MEELIRSHVAHNKFAAGMGTNPPAPKAGALQIHLLAFGGTVAQFGEPVKVPFLATVSKPYLLQ